MRYFDAVKMSRAERMTQPPAHVAFWDYDRHRAPSSTVRSAD